MNGETFIVDPDFSVIFGCRSILSLVGLATGVVGYYLMERQWDNEGPVALALPQVVVAVDVETDDKAGNDADASSSYVNMTDPNKVVGQAFHYSGARDLVRVRTDDSADVRYHPRQAAGNTGQPVTSTAGTPQALEAQLASAFPVPRMMLTGLGLWSLSFFLDPAIGGFRLYANFFNIASFLLSLLIGPLLAFPMRKAILRRDIEQKKKLVLALVMISLLICIFSITDPEVDAPWYFNIVAVLFIFASAMVFMKSRKMGYTWLYEGKSQSNSSIMVQNFGPLLLIFGTYLLWVGTNAIEMADLNQSYVPFWTTTARGWFVFIAGMMFIVPGQLVMDLAFDQGSLPVTPGIRDSYVYKLNGNTFEALARDNTSRFDVVWLAGYLEIPLLESIGWFFMGLSSFMPFYQDLTFQKFFTMFICFGIPPVRCGLVSPALWRSDPEAYEKWLYIYYGLMSALVIAIGMSTGIGLTFSLFGVGLILAGQRKEHYDERKCGNLWLTGTPPTINPNPQVYGLGKPLSILGWIMLCTAMSVPM
mmetsp:Transcript_18302/g.42135  ORF Transcript_18302/g.42135 Transcript_18302/m.42135 type:complete len:533 (-) Transcript_18302:201-1799(-)